MLKNTTNPLIRCAIRSSSSLNNRLYSSSTITTIINTTKNNNIPHSTVLSFPSSHLYRSRVINSNTTCRYYSSSKGLAQANIFESGVGEAAENITIDGYADQGFSVNKVLIPGSIVATPTLLLLWDVHSVDEITLDSLSILNIIEPQLEFILVGTGRERKALNDQVVSDINKRFGVNIESMATINAIGTYNILVEEGRRVGAFLLPLDPCREARQDQLVTKKEYQEITESVSFSKHQKQVMHERLQRDQPVLPGSANDANNDSGKNIHHLPLDKQIKATKNIQEKAPPQRLNMVGKFMVWAAETFGGGSSKDKDKYTKDKDKK